jgi:hypothetical protein
MPYIDMDLLTVQITLLSGRVDTYRGVFTVINDGVLSVFTFDYLDPAEWRQQEHNRALRVVRAYSLHAVESWTEDDHDGPPHIVAPAYDLDGRPLGPPPPYPVDEVEFTHALARRGVDNPERFR